jgi:hypothetical protein
MNEQTITNQAAAAHGKQVTVRYLDWDLDQGDPIPFEKTITGEAFWMDQRNKLSVTNEGDDALIHLDDIVSIDPAPEQV